MPSVYARYSVHTSFRWPPFTLPSASQKEPGGRKQSRRFYGYLSIEPFRTCAGFTVNFLYGLPLPVLCFCIGLRIPWNCPLSLSPFRPHFPPSPVFFRVDQATRRNVPATRFCLKREFYSRIHLMQDVQFLSDCLDRPAGSSVSRAHLRWSYFEIAISDTPLSN